MLERAFVGAQLIELMLGEVADLKPLASAKLARHRGEVADDALDERGLARAVDAENADALARADRERDAVDHDALVVAETKVFRIDEMLGQADGLRKLEAPLALGAHGLDGLELFEHLDAGLGLAGLRRLGAEALDEAREMRGFALVGLGGRILQAELFNALSFKGGVVAGVAADGLVLDGPDRRDGAVEKLAVVRNDDDGRLDAPKPVFEPDERVDVEMVRRFVKEQQVGRTHQRPGERDAVAPAARKVVDGTLEVALAKAEARENRAGLRDDGAFVEFG